MKKLVLFIMAVIGFAGMSLAQDIYSSGYYISSGVRYSAVYKNTTRLYIAGGSSSYRHESSDVLRYNGNTYWTDNAVSESDGSFNFGDVWKNNDRWLSNPTGTGSHIYALYKIPTLSYIYSIGCTNVNSVKTAVVWRDNSSTVYKQLGNGTQPSEAYGCTNYSENLYTCGYQHSNSSTYHGVIWNGTTSSVIKNFDNGTKLYGIAYYDGYFYTVGSAKETSGSTTVTKLKVWKTSFVDGSTTVKYTLSSSMDDGFVDNRFSIHIESGDIYVNGMDDTSEKVWKNGDFLYSGGSNYFHSVRANTNGVYYAGGNSSEGKIWKDGSQLYSLSDCRRITSLFIEEPECADNEVRGLPFTDGFENGNTSLPCWTLIDSDNNNGLSPSYWHREGNRLWSGCTGDYCMTHYSSTNSQSGWLITPRLYLQAGRTETGMSFKSWTGGSIWLDVYVTTISNPDISNPSNWDRVFHQRCNDTWATQLVDLHGYQGQAVYVAFVYSGYQDYVWAIDDVSITETFAPCSAMTAPYTWDFEAYNDCWMVNDLDMTPQFIVSGTTYYPTWAFNSSAGSNGSGCIWHHWGPQNVPQTAWLFSRRVTLPSGNYNYKLSFKSKTIGSGTGKKNTVWIAQDESGAPNVSHYTTKLWEDQNYSSSWTTYEVDLTAYKGSTVTIAFKYEGTYAHSWYLDDFSITQEVSEYTITANANNNAWGTVSGGGNYAPGATCVLHATPNTGYVFQNWKKNGTIVSTNPNYSFTVNESATYTAYFGEAPVVYYDITTNVTPAGAGTVTGGGTYASGTSVTLTATANPGYTFSQWQDGSTSNPRTITVTGDATYTAQFTQDTYTITTSVTPAGSGTVTGGGSNFHYGDVATLTATPNANYEFAGWQDGNTDNPRSVTVTGNASFTATFNEVGTTWYNVTADVNPAGAGIVTGTGTFEAGSTTQLEAQANPGYTFDHWQDGSTLNPRSVTVNSDLNFTAYFTQNQYIITVVASPSNGGVVGGGGAFYYGDIATLTATPNTGYEFVGWSDGSPEPNHQVMVTDNATYTATFVTGGGTYYTVSAYVSPAGAGTVSGTGSFAAGTTTTLTAQANDGYVFDHWNDGSTSNPRTVTVNNNMSFTAYFNTNQYTITVNASPTGSGTVSGGGQYAYGATAMLTATPNSGYSFMQWSDGNTSNPRYVTVTGNATYTALFMSAGGDTYLVTVTTSNPLLGQVTGSGVFPAGVLTEIRAIPASYARFVQWNDGNTENPRMVTVSGNLDFIAQFVAIPLYTITVNSSNEEWGYVVGGGTFNEGTQIEIAAFANPGYMFTGWNDGNNQNPRPITVTSNVTYTAQFAESSMTTYTLNLICNTSEGSVSGGGTYIAGTTVNIQAFPNPGYVFTKWSDENTQNPRQVTVNSDMTLVAYFATGVDESQLANIKVYPNPAKETIRLIGIEANSQVEIYNSLGELVKVVSVSENQEIGVRDLAAGLYMVRCGTATLRFVKEQ